MSLTPKKSFTFFRPDLDSDAGLPFAADAISAGFPSPAQDFMESTIDLNKELTDNPLATFYIRVNGNSMINAGINDKDVLVVDRSLEPRDNKIAICFIDGEFTVKRLRLEKDCLYLMPENDSYTPIKVTEDNQVIIWGIVTYVIKKI
ncbi:LexA family protein [Flavobacterium kingsejongi]|uniref:Peptidase S24 n=1 Tax=Flavobacterium kingsejongi TaxID=1678728 RepID=A0A2S1LM98_9FLAO|nr:translesion error-prone DNA polymerase V autoproteolytic subunit [Flavobacterium kingsejongi]AWG24857.1 peptidase S24 [Flavobacterium kingsejongi]